MKFEEKSGKIISIDQEYESFNDPNEPLDEKITQITGITDEMVEGKSIDWSEFCHFPWSSFGIKSNGEVAMCSEDYNNEIILGDARKESLKDIWNGKKYIDFRKVHFYKKSGDKDNMCTEHCDKKIIGDFLN